MNRKKRQRKKNAAHRMLNKSNWSGNHVYTAAIAALASSSFHILNNRSIHSHWARTQAFKNTSNNKNRKSQYNTLLLFLTHFNIYLVFCFFFVFFPFAENTNSIYENSVDVLRANESIHHTIFESIRIHIKATHEILKYEHIIWIHIY